MPAVSPPTNGAVHHNQWFSQNLHATSRHVSCILLQVCDVSNLYNTMQCCACQSCSQECKPIIAQHCATCQQCMKLGQLLAAKKGSRTDPVTRAGPKALAGLMHMELTGPRIHMSKQIAKGTASGPSLPHPLHMTACTQNQQVAKSHVSRLCLA